MSLPLHIMGKPSTLTIIVVAAASITNIVSGQITVKGTCAAFDSKQKFSNSMFYSGTWFVIEGYTNRYNGNVSCEEFSFSTDHKHVYINHTFFSSSSQNMTTVSGKARVLLSKDANRLVLSPGIKSFPVDSYLWIVSTDYSSYAVLYVCQQLNRSSAKEYAFILSRSPDLLPGIKARLIVSHIVQEGLPVEPLKAMEQENCPRR